MEKIRVGIVASGMMAQKHADALRRIAGVEVAGIADPYEENLTETANALGIPNTFKDYREMCEMLNVDVLHNCTPNNEHYKINEYAIKKGIGIYAEKPLAVTGEEAFSLCELLRENPVPNGVNFNYRSNAMVREMRAKIRNGNAGRPLLIHGSYLQDWLMYENDYNWRLDSSKGGKSRTVADIGSHWFDTVQTILDSKIKAVYANLLTVYPERFKPLKETGTFAKASDEMIYEKAAVDTEDAGMILIRFENGLSGSVVLSQVSGGYKNALTVSVDCAECSLRWNQEQADHMIIGNRELGEIKTYAASGDMTDDAAYYQTLPGGHPMGWADALSNNMRLFYDAVKAGTYSNAKQEYATFEDAAYIMKIVDACLKSNEKKEWVFI